LAQGVNSLKLAYHVAAKLAMPGSSMREVTAEKR